MKTGREEAEAYATIAVAQSGGAPSANDSLDRGEVMTRSPVYEATMQSNPAYCVLKEKN